MKHVLSLFLTFLLCAALSAQSYNGYTKKSVNLRSGPSKDSTILTVVPAFSQLFINSKDTVNGFYSVIDIKTNLEGYVYWTFVTLGDSIKENAPGMFVATQRTSQEDPQIKIYNNTKLPLTLKLNSTIYTFEPQEKKTITLKAGYCHYRASAPGVNPNIGTEAMQGNMLYEWEFFLVTRPH